MDYGHFRAQSQYILIQRGAYEQLGPVPKQELRANTSAYPFGSCRLISSVHEGDQHAAHMLV